MLTFKKALLYLGLAVWLGGLVTTFFYLSRYTLTPGTLAEAPAQWPAKSAIRRAPGVANVVMIAHPLCPCTKASMTELARLADELGSRARIHVILVRPEGVGTDWQEGTIADRARALPNADVIIDDGGREARLFGAIVSGSTIVYGRDGALLFRGGLTTARGHEGRGPAQDRIVALVSGRAADRDDAPTFGCALDDPEPPQLTAGAP